jgi:predicted Zn-dependent protease
MLSGLAMSAQEQSIGRGVNFYSIEKEAALGAEMAQDVRRSTTAIDSAKVQDYVERLGRQLAAQLPDTGSAFTFSVVADDLSGPTHEPPALPGGYIFVPAGLILAARDEAEFAGMLAHAMAHVAARHGTRQATRATIMGMADIPVIYMGGWSGRGGEPSIPLGLLAFQRAFESEADRLAVITMARAGYDPEALVGYIRRVQPVESDRQDAFSPLPSRAARVASMEQTIRELPSRTYTASGGISILQEEVRHRALNQVRRPPSLQKQ